MQVLFRGASEAYQRDIQRQARGQLRQCSKIKRDAIELTAWLKMRVPLAKHVLCYDRLRAEIETFMQTTNHQRPRTTFAFLIHCDAICGVFVRDEKVDSGPRRVPAPRGPAGMVRGMGE
jgi:hypothetical protein